MNKKNKGKIFLIITIILLLLGVFILAMNHSPYGNKKSIVKVKDQPVRVELVKTREKMEQGLSGRKGLCEACGMLFLFEKKGIYSFWMKDMKFDLDLIWIDGKSIIKIERSIPASYPDTMKNEVAADKVLEVPSGFCDRYGILVGDKLEM